MEELILISFFRTLPDFFRMDPPYITIYALTFLGAAITEFLILYCQRSTYLLVVIVCHRRCCTT